MLNCADRTRRGVFIAVWPQMTVSLCNSTSNPWRGWEETKPAPPVLFTLHRDLLRVVGTLPSVGVPGAVKEVEGTVVHKKLEGGFPLSLADFWLQRGL
jgi:hypothetical protein